MVKELTEEQKIARRKKELAILKAENEMLENVKSSLANSDKYDEMEQAELVESISTAQAENLQKGKSLYGADAKEIGNMRYGKASKHYVDKYNERLQKKGITDEQLHVKDISNESLSVATVSYGKDLNDEEDINFDIESNVVKNNTPIGYVGSLKNHKRKKEIFDSETNNDYDNTVIIPEVITSKDNVKPILEINKKYIEDDNFDITGIPDYVQYDVLPLPSDGQCYKSKKSRIPVAYLTASDENLITSPNLYRDGKILDMLLKRKVLDKSINVDELCKGDRDAIILWLRATGYGVDFPIKVHDPELDTDYDTVVQLDQIKTKPFTLTGDENGWFDYETNSGDKIKFKYLNRLEELELQKSVRFDTNNQRKQKIANIAKDLTDEAKDDTTITISEKNKLLSAAKLIKSWSDKIKGNNEHDGYGKQMTTSMVLSTMSVNGNTDREYIQHYIENMRTREAYDYRTYITEHEPGMDFNITINRPESLGGGSFDTFLEFNSFIFLSIS